MPNFHLPEGYEINYEIHGNPTSKLAIVFAHGNGNCIEDWNKLGYTDLLKSQLLDAKFIFMDALGYGQSDKPVEPEDYTPERRAEDVVSLMDHLEITKAVFFGASLGGSLGFVLADLYPEKFTGFIIGSAHPYGHKEPIGSNIFDKSFRDLIQTKGIEGFVAELEAKFLGQQFHPAVRPQYIQNDGPAIIAANIPEWPDRSAILAKIKVPVLLFAGDNDPVQQFQAVVASQIPGAEVIIIPNTDHCDAYWESSQVVPIISGFINKNREKLLA